MSALEVTQGVRGAAVADDDALVLRACRGDADAFAVLVADRLPRMLRLARSILHDETDARDATQEAFVSVWQHLPRLRDAGRFDAWLNTVLANRCRDLLRRRGRVREIDLAGAELRAPDPAPHALERAAVLAAFDRLSLPDRQILALHHLEDRPLDQVARSLGIPIGTAKSRLHAARKALGRALETQA
jgi:RNA polymerase sigma-70 factor (ECF subfamily)